LAFLTISSFLVLPISTALSIFSEASFLASEIMSAFSSLASANIFSASSVFFNPSSILLCLSSIIENIFSYKKYHKKPNKIKKFTTSKIKVFQSIPNLSSWSIFYFL
jgi:hypothetical protein